MCLPDWQAKLGNGTTRGYGGLECCSDQNKCGLGEGNCESHSHCLQGLSCINDTHLCRTLYDPSFPNNTNCCYLNCQAGRTRGRDCCTKEKPCPIGEGDCDHHHDCMPGLKCGLDNCKSFDPAFPASDYDCCYKREQTYSFEFSM